MIEKLIEQGEDPPQLADHYYNLAPAYDNHGEGEGIRAVTYVERTGLHAQLLASDIQRYCKNSRLSSIDTWESMATTRPGSWRRRTLNHRKGRQLRNKYLISLMNLVDKINSSIKIHVYSYIFGIIDFLGWSELFVARGFFDYTLLINREEKL